MPSSSLNWLLISRPRASSVNCQYWGGSETEHAHSNLQSRPGSCRMKLVIWQSPCVLAFATCNLGNQPHSILSGRACSPRLLIAQWFLNKINNLHLCHYLLPRILRGPQARSHLWHMNLQPLLRQNQMQWENVSLFPKGCERLARSSPRDKSGCIDERYSSGITMTTVKA